MNKVIIITGASSGFGALTARALARAGHTVYASMRETNGRNKPPVEAVQKYAAENKVDLRAIAGESKLQSSFPVRSLPAPTISRIQGNRLMRNAQRNTKRDLTPDSLKI